jgi:hypothetical protein
MSLAPTGERFVVGRFLSHALGMLESIGWIAARRFLFSRLRFQLLGWPAFLSSAEAVPPHLDQRGCNSERSRSGLQRAPLAPVPSPLSVPDYVTGKVEHKSAETVSSRPVQKNDLKSASGCTFDTAARFL